MKISMKMGLSLVLFNLMPMIASASGYLTEEQAMMATASQYHPAVVRHIVAFKFKSNVTSAQIELVKRKFLALKTEAVRNERRYIHSIEVGNANSFEGADQGMQICFIVTFGSEGDRNFYVGQPLINPEQKSLYDLHHLAFKNFVGPLLDGANGAFVFDLDVSGRARI